VVVVVVAVDSAVETVEVSPAVEMMDPLKAMPQDQSLTKLFWLALPKS